MNKFTQFLKTALFDPFVRSFFRFTETLVVSGLIIILTIISNETVGREIFNPILRALWLLLPLLIFVTLASERFGLKKLWKYLLVTAAVLGAVTFYFLMKLEPNREIESMRFASLIAMSSILALCVPYFPNRKNFATYTMFLASKLFATLFYAGVLYGALVAIFASIESLFSLNLGTYIYMNLLIIIVGLVAIPIFLGFIPSLSREMQTSDYNKIWKTVFSFIIIPFVAIFSVILLIYIVTSTFNQNYYSDVFIIASMAIGIIGLFALFALEPFIDESPHLRFVDKYWPIFYLAILIGFVVEVIREVISFGFSMWNTTSIYIGVWLVAMLLLKIIKQSPFKLEQGQTLFLSSVDTLFLIMLFPFINVVNVATYQYNAQLKAVLTKYDMLVDGAIVARSDLTTDQQIEISSVVSRLREVGFARIKYLPSGFQYTDFESVFGFLPYQIHDPENQYVYISAGLEVPFINISELPSYERLYDFRYLPLEEDSTDTFIIEKDESVYTMTDNSFTFTFDLAPIAVAINELRDGDQHYFSLNDLTFTQTTDTIEMTFYIREFSGYYYFNTHKYTPSSGSLLIGINII